MRVLVGVVLAPSAGTGRLRGRRERRAVLDRTAERAAALMGRLYPAITVTDTGRWVDPSARVMLLGLSDEPRETWMVERRGGRAAALWAGHVAAPPSPTSPLEPGGHAVRLVGRAREGLTAVHGRAGINPTFFRQGAGMTVVSNRATLAHLLAQEDDEPEVDPLGAVTLLTAGFVFARRHTLAGTRILDPGQSLTVDLDAQPSTQRVPVDRRPLSLAEGGVALADRLTAVCASLREPDLRCGLTGGRDTRMIAAALHHAGQDFLGFTSGFPGTPDVEIGAILARRLGVEHKVVEPKVTSYDTGAVVEIDVIARTLDALHASDGMVNGFDNLQSIGPYRRFLNLGGAGGEVHRGGHQLETSERTLHDFKRLLRNRYQYSAGLLTEATARHVRAQLRPWRQLAEQDVPTAFDQLYLRWRVGRWAAATHLTKNVSRQVVLPLLDDQVIGVSHRTAYADRVTERLYHEALRHMAPQLLDVPFDKGWWVFLRERGEQGPPRPSTIVAAPDRPRFQARTSLDAGARQVFREVILDGGGASPLWEVLDRTATEARLAEDPEDFRLWWRLLTLRLVLDGHPWRSTPPPSAVVRVPVPEELTG